MLKGLFGVLVLLATCQASWAGAVGGPKSSDYRSPGENIAVEFEAGQIAAVGISFARSDIRPDYIVVIDPDGNTILKRRVDHSFVCVVAWIPTKTGVYKVRGRERDGSQGSEWWHWATN